MKVRRTELEGLLVIEPDLYSDNRGFFLETFRVEKYEEAGIPGPFLQDNLSYSVRGVIRGLHLQMPKPQGKLVHVVQGEVFDVSVDLRVGSPTFGRWVGYTLSGENKIQLYLPPGSPTASSSQVSPRSLPTSVPRSLTPAPS